MTHDTWDMVPLMYVHKDKKTGTIHTDRDCLNARAKNGRRKALLKLKLQDVLAEVDRPKTCYDTCRSKLNQVQTHAIHRALHRLHELRVAREGTSYDHMLGMVLNAKGQIYDRADERDAQEGTIPEMRWLGQDVWKELQRSVDETINYLRGPVGRAKLISELHDDKRWGPNPWILVGDKKAWGGSRMTEILLDVLAVRRDGKQAVLAPQGVIQRLQGRSGLKEDTWQRMPAPDGCDQDMLETIMVLYQPGSSEAMGNLSNVVDVARNIHR